jgi:signal transduction histidine kinase
VEPRASERLGALAGLIACVAVGAAVLSDGAGDGPVQAAGVRWLWWSSYLLYLGAFVLVGQLPLERRQGWLDGRRLLAVQVASGATAYVLAPARGWAVVLLVVTAATCAYELSRRATVAVVIGQTVLIAIVTLRTELVPLDAAVSVAVFASFQLFAVMVIWTQQREAAARERLAAAHTELRATTALLGASSRAAERLRIARDLHDVLGHELTALILELEAASHAGPGAESLHVGRARDIARDLLDSVRGAVDELRSEPPALQQALTGLITGLPRPLIDLSVDDDLDVDDATSLALIRCVQEIITNTVRHAEATRLRIVVSSDGTGGVRLSAQDDGHGSARLHPGNGLHGIRERIEEVGGAVEFVTGPGEGMLVRAGVPGR